MSVSAHAQVRSSLKGITTVNAVVVVTAGPGFFESGVLSAAQFKQDLLTTYMQELATFGVSVVTDVPSTPVVSGCQVVLSRREDANLVLYRWDSVILDRGIVQRRRSLTPEYVVTWSANFLGSQPAANAGLIAAEIGKSCAHSLGMAWLAENPPR